MNITALDYHAIADIQEKLDGDLILFGSHYNTRFEDVFLTASKTIDVKKENYLNWVLNCMENPLEKYMKEVAPYKYAIDAHIALKQANAVNLTMLIIKKKIALYKHNQVISYEVS